MIVARTINTSYSILRSHNGCDAAASMTLPIPAQATLDACRKFLLDKNMYSLYCLLQVYMHSVSQYCGTIEPFAAVLVPEAMLDVWAAGSFGWALKH